MVAQAWATLLHVGRGGFEAKARGLADARDAVVAFVRERVPELRLLADHDATCPAVVPLGLAPGSPVASVYAVAHHMAARGWNLPTGQKPACVSVLLAYQHAGPLLDALLADLRAAVDAAVAAPDAKLDGELAVYGAADAIPDVTDRSYTATEAAYVAMPTLVEPGNARTTSSIDTRSAATSSSSRHSSTRNTTGVGSLSPSSPPLPVLLPA